MDTPINLIYLKYFCDAVRLKSISQAAKVNFVTQSAVSQAINKLERYYKKELIVHKQNKFQATLEGEFLFSKGIELLQKSQHIQEELVQERIPGTIDIACTHSFALALLPKYLKKLKDLYPELHVNIHLGHLGIIKDLLHKGHVDCGIALINEELPQLQIYPIYEGFYRTYVASNLDRYKTLPFILSEERKETSLLKSAWKKRFKKDLSVLMEVSSWEVIASLCEQGLGIGFVPDYIVKDGRRKLKEINLGLKTFPYIVGAIFTKTDRLSRKAQALLNVFQG
jgi:DNA-binding transcriptional LysR family regulator